MPGTNLITLVRKTLSLLIISSHALPKTQWALTRVWFELQVSLRSHLPYQTMNSSQARAARQVAHPAVFSSTSRPLQMLGKYLEDSVKHSPVIELSLWEYVISLYINSSHSLLDSKTENSCRQGRHLIFIP